ncbi:MAG: GNAT family N-acetyltransferase [Solobacterium sp.]|nr:GNAT family N-acetyltransferase [Solobacterium sp.]
MNIPIDVSQTILHTNRLLLRPFKESDVDDLFEYASIDGVGQMAGWKPHQSKEESKAIIDLFINKKKTFAIEYNNKVIGSIGIEMYDEKLFPELDSLKGREIGYVLSKDYWGRGIMPEGVQEVMRYLFEDLGVDFLMCAHFGYNHQSKRVIEKCGFIHYASTTKHTLIDTDEELEIYIKKKDF